MLTCFKTLNIQIHYFQGDGLDVLAVKILNACLGLHVPPTSHLMIFSVGFCKTASISARPTIRDLRVRITEAIALVDRDGEKNTGTVISELFRDRNCSINEQVVGPPCSKITVVPWSGIVVLFPNITARVA